MSSDRFQPTVTAWEKAARSPVFAQRIHPSGRHPSTYRASGFDAAEEVATIIPPNDELTIGDFGAGDGRVAAHLAERYGHVVAFDASPTMLRRLAENVPDVTGILWDGVDVLELEEPLDALVTINVLIHHTYEDGAAILANLARTVRPGGILAVQVPIYDLATPPTSWTSVGTWTPSEFLKAAALAELNVEAMHANPGTYTPGAAGPHHHRLHHLIRP